MSLGNKKELMINSNSETSLDTSNNKRKPYGYELIMDLHGCNVLKFTREILQEFFIELCKLIRMQRCELHFWDDVGVPVEEQQTSPHTKGTSAVQFILTSSIVIHTLDLMGVVYINIFSCNYFNEKVALEFTKKWFSSTECTSHYIERV